MSLLRVNVSLSVSHKLTLWIEITFKIDLGLVWLGESGRLDIGIWGPEIKDH